MTDPAADDRPRAMILGVPVDRISCARAAELICDWAAAGASRTVLAANVHMTMEAVDDPSFRAVMERADLVVADGRPLDWVLKARGYTDAHHVRGQDLLLAVCAAAERRGLAVGMYGSTQGVMKAASQHLSARFPRLAVVYAAAAPFGLLVGTADQGVVDAVTTAGARVLFVALGCPKQEKWMAAHRGSLPAAMIGAGAAVDMIGGLQPVAPRWMQTSGLEWVYRLASDPVRLWRRYARHNLRFVLLAGAETVRLRRTRRAAGPRS